MDRQAGPMTAATWGCCPAPRCPGELLTRGDVYHVHASRAEAERCGVLLGGTPELVRLEDPARGLPCGVVAVKRRERTATSPGLEVRDVSRRGASPAVAGRVRGPVVPISRRRRPNRSERIGPPPPCPGLCAPAPAPVGIRTICPNLHRRRVAGATHEQESQEASDQEEPVTRQRKMGDDLRRQAHGGRYATAVPSAALEYPKTIRSPRQTLNSFALATEPDGWSGLSARQPGVEGSLHNRQRSTPSDGTWHSHHSQAGDTLLRNSTS